MRALNKRLWRMINHTKGQFIAVTVVLAVGLLSYTALNMTLMNLETTVNTYYDMTNMAHGFSDVMRISESKVEALRKVAGVADVNGRVVEEVKFVTGQDTDKVTVRLISLADSLKPINDVYLVDGTRPQSDNQALVIEMFATARGLRVNDEFDVLIGGRHKTLKVAGIVANPEYIYLIEDEQSLLPDAKKFGVVFITKEFAQSQLGYSGAFNNLLFTFEEGVDEEVVLNALEKKLDTYGVLRLFKREDLISARMVHEEITQGKKTANTVPVVFLGVAAFIIAVMIGRIVKNDRITIGVFKAMGYTNGQIMWHYAKYALMIGLIGSAAGMLLGAASANELASVYTDTVFNIPILIGRIYPEYLVLAMVLGSVFCVAAGFYGARAIMTIHPAESMRPEAPKTGKRIFLEKYTRLWRRVSFSWKIVIRNILRSKKRVVFIVLGIALTYAITLAPFNMLGSFFTMFDKQYGQMYSMDYTLTLNRPVPGRVVYDIAGLVNADAIEPVIEFPFEVQSGWRKKIVNILGVESDSTMYHFSKPSGEAMSLPDHGIALTEGLARLLKVDVGDKVTIATFVPGRDDLEIPVSAIVEQPLGVNAYMNIGYMQDKLLDRDMVNVVVLKGKNIEPGIFDTIKNIKNVQSLSDLRGVFEQFTTLTYSSILVMIVSSGILGFAIVYNSTVMSINERKLEFSSLRVLGFEKNAIFVMLVRENLVMALIGIIMGIPLGAGLLQVMIDSFSNELYTLKVGDDFMSYLYTGLVVVMFVLIAQYATYGKIKKLDFIEALKARVS